MLSLILLKQTLQLQFLILFFQDVDPTSSLPSPRGLRVLRAPKFETPGEEIILRWNPPVEGEEIRGYEVTTTVPGQENLRSTTSTTLEY